MRREEESMTEIDWSKPHAVKATLDKDWSQPKETGWASIGRDIKKIPGNIKTGVKATAEDFPGIGEQYYDEPSRLPKLHVVGLARSLHGLINSPGALRDYLAEKEVIPKGTPSFRLPESLLPSHIPEEDVYKRWGLGEKRKGDIAAQLLPDLLAGGPGALKAAVSTAKVGVDIARKTAPYGIKAGQKVIEKGKSAKENISSILGKINERPKKIEAIEERQRQLKGDILKEKIELPEAQIKIAANIGKAIEAEQLKRSPHEKGLAPYIANKQEEKIGKSTATLTHAKEKDILPKIEAAYARFGEDNQGGKVKIKEENAIPVSSLEKELEGIEKYASPKLNQVISKTIGKIQKVESSHSELPSFTVPKQAKATVNDYITLWKTSRDEARLISNRIENDSRLTNADIQDLREKRSKLTSFSKRVKNSIEESLSPEKRAEYQQIQHDYEHLEVPFKESNLLSNATERHPTVKTGKFSQKLTLENHPKLRKYLLENHPEFKEALASYDLQNLDLSNHEKLRSLLESDQGRALPEKVQKDIGQIARSLESKKNYSKYRKRFRLVK